MTKRRILLVDDEVSTTRALALYLTENGNCDVRVENVGSHAVATAREFRPDLIFLDIVMPDADGGALAAEIQADPTLQGTPLVFLTALVSQRETRGGEAKIGAIRSSRSRSTRRPCSQASNSTPGKAADLGPAAKSPGNRHLAGRLPIVRRLRLCWWYWRSFATP